ncbi:NAD(P)-dependent oxidoreductase [Saccharothrix coeruleofusca]|uniref:Dehydrogenase n=1 Tax=Saccharothrix coeruleofusca TaxID=33919 RepID=A0A918EF63_9PSEU|nr:NAD(P)-binding domain-containing protein [Saccharothrix coeruleofusca]GGP58491.1 dehydrogenase [Saccharothrix coeruleofusca]
MTGEKTPLTLIGLGPMGRGMVAKFLEHGHPVTVWNRTASRADELVAKGAVRAETAAAAVGANRLVLLSLTDYAAMYEILDGTPLAGRVVVNLSSDTPEETVRAAAWLAERGAELITGGVMVPAPLIGTESAYVFYSGPREVLEPYEPTLSVIGRPEYVGAEHSLAQLFYQAQLDAFLTGLAGILHAFALVGTAGVPARNFVRYLADNVDSLGLYLDETVRHLDEGNHPGDEANVLMMGATARHVVGASEAGGIDAELPRAVQSLYDRAIAAGHGRESWTSLIEVIRKR